MATEEEFRSKIVPVLVFFVVLNTVGFLGNVLVIYVYTFRYEKNHFRRLVLSLSFVDTTSCCTTVPMETVSTWFWFSAPSRGLCKVKNFCVQFSALSAIYMLFITAIYKYLRICRPHGKQVNQKNILVSFIAGICVSLVLASPAAVIWDVNVDTITINNENETYHICEVYKGYRHTAYPVVYRSVLSVCDLFLLATIVMYVFVAKTVILHIRRKQKKEKTRKSENEPSISVETDDKSEHSANETVSDPGTMTNSRNIATRQTTRARRFKLSSSQIRKAIIMVILAGTFSVTFLMGLSFGYVFALRDYSEFASVGETVTLFACYRFYFANYALNPIVYFVLDRSFRREVLKLFGKLKLDCAKPA